MTDPAIWITESVYIQVGSDYVVIFSSKNNGLSAYHCTLAINDIMAKLRQAVNESK